MIVIADSNIFISCFYSPNGTIAGILSYEKNVQFIAPDYIYEEIIEHLKEIIRSTKRNKTEISTILKNITKNVKFYSADDIDNDVFHRAYDIMKEIDPDDTPFLALHFHTGHKIWTGDKVLINGLIEKGYDICITTEELKNKLYKKSSD